MLFNLDKETKKNILEHYKQEALFKKLKKEEEKKREIEEERKNLEQKQKRQKQTIDIMNKEKFYNRNKLKEEYNLMLQKTKGYIPRKMDIKINNWGQSKDQFILPEVKTNNNNYINEKTDTKSFLNNYNKYDFVQLSPYQKEKEILKQVDHMNEYLTDKQNINELIQYFKIQKENRHKFYKDLLFSQYKNALNKNLNLYGTNDELILKQRKKKFISENPYIRQRKYDFGSSSLEHNPILNPENNYDYNKYINFKNFSINGRNNNKLKENKGKSYDNYLQRNFSNFNNNLNKENNPYYLYDNNYNLNDNILNGSNSVKVNKNILNKNYSRNHYISLNSETPLQITNNKFSIINNKTIDYNHYNNEDDYNIKKSFSQGDIFN
jgi:hypothetical protein